MQNNNDYMIVLPLFSKDITLNFHHFLEISFAYPVSVYVNIKYPFSNTICPSFYSFYSIPSVVKFAAIENLLTNTNFVPKMNHLK